jgi:hypothetical protein
LISNVAFGFSRRVDCCLFGRDGIRWTLDLVAPELATGAVLVTGKVAAACSMFIVIGGSIIPTVDHFAETVCEGAR